MEFKVAASEDELKRTADAARRRAHGQDAAAARRALLPPKLTADDYAGPGGGESGRPNGGALRLKCCVQAETRLGKEDEEEEKIPILMGRRKLIFLFIKKNVFSWALVTYVCLYMCVRLRRRPPPERQSPQNQLGCRQGGPAGERRARQRQHCGQRRRQGARARGCKHLFFYLTVVGSLVPASFFAERFC